MMTPTESTMTTDNQVPAKPYEPLLVGWISSTQPPAHCTTSGARMNRHRKRSQHSMMGETMHGVDGPDDDSPKRC